MSRKDLNPLDMCGVWTGASQLIINYIILVWLRTVTVTNNQLNLAANKIYYQYQPRSVLKLIKQSRLFCSRPGELAENISVN